MKLKNIKLYKKIFDITTETIPNKQLDIIHNLISKYDRKSLIERIRVYQKSLRSYMIFCDNIIIKVYRNNNYFLNDYCALKKLNELHFTSVIKLIHVDDINNIIIFDKIQPIGYERLSKKYVNKENIKQIFILILRTIHSLYKYNQQYNITLNYTNIGIDYLGNFKIYDLEKSEYINVENEYILKELLFKSFYDFYVRILIEVKYYNNKELENNMINFMNNFKNVLTDRRKVIKPTITGNIKKYYFFAFKFINFEGILDYTKKW